MALDDRKGRILHAIVNDYVETAEPIGSEWLASRHDFGCKSATLRNEMAEMSERGYLVQPHTSSGRIPSSRGYRYFVDRLMPLSNVGENIEFGLGLQTGSARINELVQLTARMLANMTQYPSVATTPIMVTTTVHRLFLSVASSRHILVVILLSNGHLEHRLAEVEQTPKEESLSRIALYVNSVFVGKDIEEIAKSELETSTVDSFGESLLMTLIHENIVDLAGKLSDNRLICEGASHILHQREFHDVIRLEQLLSALEQQSVLFDVFTRTTNGERVTVIIGEESPFEAMADCSLVTSRYRIGNRTCGFLGVVGPTRMRYEQAVSAVGMMANSLSTMLTRTALE